jgi:thiol-disulfide isomerase/thioredoxin
MRLIRPILTIFALCLALNVFAQSQPQQVLKEINDLRAAEINKARQTQAQLDVVALNAKIKAKAEAAIEGRGVAAIAAADSFDWARIFQLAERHKDACDLAHKFLMTNPESQARFDAQLLMMASCNELGEGDMLAATLVAVRVPSLSAAGLFANNTAYLYSETIAKTEGVEKAIEVLAEVERNLDLGNPKEHAAKLLADEKARRQPGAEAKPDAERLIELEKMVQGQIERARITLVSKRAQLLAQTGKRSEALTAIEDVIRSLPSDSGNLRGINAEKKQIEMVGLGAPALAVERGYGTFNGLESLRGKVVLIDFFAHWCGPCINSFPDMRKMYADLKDKGLEIVGVTTYYGYYGQERDLSKDDEYARMSDFISKHQLPWPVVYGDRSNFEGWAVTGIPHVTVIDRDGNVRKIKIGYSPASFGEFRREIEKLLEK